MKRNVLFLMLFSLFSMVACVKEGPIGPEGPQGPQGPQGIPGSANVKRFSYTISTSSFSKLSGTNEYWKYQTIGTSIGINDAVLVFINENLAGTYEWVGLPFVDYWSTGNCFNVHNFSIASGNKVQFTIRNSCGSVPYSNMSTGSLSYRVFVIAGAPGKQVLDTIDATNYEAVCAAFGFDPN